MARFTNFKKDGIARLVGDGFSLVQACEEVGISRSAVYKTMRQDEEFDAGCELLLDSTCEAHLPVDILWATIMMTLLVMLEAKQEFKTG